MVRGGVTLAACLLASEACAAQQLSEAAAFAAKLDDNYRVITNVTYSTANNTELKLDVYMPDPPYGPPPHPGPTLIYFHGGGWVSSSKEQAIMSLMPFIAWGWSVVNVEYREAHVSRAPAAVEDCRCALQWVIRNAKKYRFDPNRIVVAGKSAGGHLALTTGMMPSSAGFDYACPGEGRERFTAAGESGSQYKVAAIVNLYGITDIADLLHGQNARSYAIEWLGGMADREDMARRLSPLSYVGKANPPVLTIHGDADPVVPYSQAVRFHQALDGAKVSNRLFTIPGGKHGRFTDEQNRRIYSAIREFLVSHGLQPEETKEQRPASGEGAPRDLGLVGG